MYLHLLSYTWCQDVIQQVSGAVLCHCGPCMSVKHSKVCPLCELSSQLRHAGVGIFHLSPPALHACHRIIQPWLGLPLWHILFQDRALQIWARHRVLIQIVLHHSFSGPPFEEEGDHLLCLFDQLPEEGGHLHVACPSGCPHHPTEPVLKLPAWTSSSLSPPGAPPPALCFPQQVQRNT